MNSDIAFCTGVSRNYLGDARLIAHQLKAHHPGVPVYVLVVDPVDGLFDPASEPFTLVTLDDLAEPEHARQMAFAYNGFELCCALRPLLHRYLLEQTTHDRWLFIDTDVLVRGPLDAAFDQLDQGDILLDPHRNRPAEPRYVHDEEFVILKQGLYNGGMLGVKRSDTAAAFTAWWHERLRWYCRVLENPGVDQLWLDYVPLFFPGTVINRDAGLNLGHWDLHETELTPTDDGDYLADGQRVRSVHFSGWSPDDPDRITKHAPCYDGQRIEAWSHWARTYQQLHREHTPAATRDWGYGHATFTDGTPIRDDMRWLYLDRLKQGEEITEPFTKPDWFTRETRKVWVQRRKKEVMLNLRRVKERFV